MRSRKKDLVSRVLETCKNNSLFNKGDLVLVAVSGGADSIVLLDCLCKIASALDIEIVVGHVDHSLRATSSNDALAVRRYAASRGLKTYVRRIDVASWARAKGQTLEEAGRVLRTTALKHMARHCGARVIATGHTATDQAETVLMRLIRGTGPLGLAGIAMNRKDRFVRPLLCATREEVRRYAAANGLPVLEDETNADQRHLRNWVRLKLLPLLRQKNARIEFALSELAEDATDLNDLISSLTDGLVYRDGNSVIANNCDQHLLPYVVNRAFLMLAGPKPALSRAHIEGVIRLVKAGRGELYLPERVVVRMDSGLRFSRRRERRPFSVSKRTTSDKLP